MATGLLVILLIGTMISDIWRFYQDTTVALEYFNYNIK